MQVIFYKNSSDPKKLHKNLTEVKTLSNVRMQMPFDILNPKLSVANFVNWQEINYCYIPELGRFYYCRLTLGTGEIIHIECQVDVLMSNIAKIENLTCLINRQEYKRNPYIVDNQIITQNNYNFHCRQFGNSVCANSDYNIYLTVTGGV